MLCDAAAVGPRGRRERAQEFFVKTRQDKLETKQGSGGQEIAVGANYFELIAKVSCILSLKPNLFFSLKAELEAASVQSRHVSEH